jgi:hypothetical protein
MRGLFWLLVIAVPLAGFGAFFYWIFFASLEPVARTAFSAAHSCPDERLVSRVRQDVHFFDVAFGPAAPAPEPPPEVRADPARLAIWESTQQQSRASRDEWKDAGQVIEVEGCDRREVYACFRYTETNGASNVPHCIPVPSAVLPAPPAR